MVERLPSKVLQLILAWSLMIPSGILCMSFIVLSSSCASTEAKIARQP